MKTITAAVLACAAFLIVFQPIFFSNWDQKSKDLLTAWVDRGNPSGSVAIVEIDDQSLSQFGRWPWPRDQLSRLLREIQQAGADTVVVDMVFPEPDLGIPVHPFPSETSAAQASHGPSNVIHTNDDQLAATLRGGRVVTGFLLRFPPGPAESQHCALRPLAFASVESDRANSPAFFTASGATCSLDLLSQASLGVGFFNASPDRDGLLRRVPLIAQFQSGMYPSLALSAYMTYRHIDLVQLNTNSSGAASIRLQNTVVPVDSKSDLLLRFRGTSGTIPHVSAAAVLAGKATPEALRGKVVVVGVSAMGLQDTVATPLDPSFPGYEVQATAMDNLIQDDPLRIPRAALSGELLLLLLMSAVSGLIMSRLDAVWAAPLVLSLVAATWAACVILLASTHILFSPFPATLVLFGNLAALTIWRVSTEKRRWEKQLATTRKFIVGALTSLTRIHDLETGAHVIRVQRYAKLLCEALASHPEFRRHLKPKSIQLIYELVPIHDIGKVSVPGSILRKPERLTAEEFEIIKTHVSSLGKVFLDAARSSGMKDQTTLRMATDIILTHHERWDGKGYPQGLSGNKIPAVGRIVAVADVYDALVSKRVYKAPVTHLSAIEYIAENSGTQFDPAVVDAFIQVEGAIQQIKLACEDQVDFPIVLD